MNTNWPFIFGYTATLLVCVLLIIGVISAHRSKKRLRTLLPEVLTDEWIEGRDLRKILREKGLHLSIGLFYTLMRDMCTEGRIDYFYATRDLDGTEIKVASYRRKQEVIV